MKKEKAITLISLVITIIILLILIGVTISLTLGESGIFKINEQSAKEYNKQEAIEKINLKITNTQMHTYGESKQLPTLQKLADKLCEDSEIQYVELQSKKIASLKKIQVGENTSIFTKLKEYPYEFEIDSTLKLASINGIKIADNDIETNKPKLNILWENPKPTTEDFESQTIELNNADYDYIEVIFRYNKVEADFYVQKVYKGYNFALLTGTGYSDKVVKRNVNYIDDTHLKFENAYYGGTTKVKDVCIPEKIIGYKF